MTRKNIGLAGRIAIISMLLMSFPGTAFADGGDGGFEATVDGYRITLVFSEPVKTGVNKFHVLIADSMGMPVSNAIVEVIAVPAEEMSDHSEEPAEEIHGMEMVTEPPAPDDAHGMSGMDMPEESKTDSHEEAEEVPHTEKPAAMTLAGGYEDGEYSGEIHLNASGDWTFNIHFTVGDQKTEVEIPVTVAGLDAKYGILAGFVGFNVSVMSVAAFMKRKKNSLQA